jgi:hypothetical protein
MNNDLNILKSHLNTQTLKAQLTKKIYKYKSFVSKLNEGSDVNKINITKAELKNVTYNNELHLRFKHKKITINK